MLSFTEFLVDGVGEEEREGEMQKAPSSENLTPGAMSLMADSGATGFEPAISTLTGWHVNRYTTPPLREYCNKIASRVSLVKPDLRISPNFWSLYVASPNDWNGVRHR